jgi:predicted nucleic acid-binding protein
MTSEPEPGYFFDTYALIEMQRGNPAYGPFKAASIRTHQMNLYEFAWATARAGSEALAREQLDRMAPSLLPADLEDLFAAVRFRSGRTRDRVSYVDALGYVLARRHGLRFLTGDPAFEGLENVEFVV